MIINDDSLKVMGRMDERCIDSVVTDTPYALSFMGKEWDRVVPSVDVWKEALRVSKPGAHLLAFGGDRTHHRMMVNIEDAGWEIRTCLYWVHGQGFPKSLNIGNGYGTGIKPSVEIICMARKPLEGTVAQNVLKYGTGALNIDGCRIPYEQNNKPQAGKRTSTFGTQDTIPGGDGSGKFNANDKGRWPAQLCHDGDIDIPNPQFFYCAKPSQKERNIGCEDMETILKVWNGKSNNSSVSIKDVEKRFTTNCKNNHPTVKPVNLMRWLVRMVTPIGGIVLDPYGGSGTTGIAARLEGCDYILIDTDKHYCDIATNRCREYLLYQ